MIFQKANSSIADAHADLLLIPLLRVIPAEGSLAVREEGEGGECSVFGVEGLDFESTSSFVS